MTFRETLKKHLDAIQNRDLDAFRSTLPIDLYKCVAIGSTGSILADTSDVLEAHRNWFLDKDWVIQFREISVFERPSLCHAHLELVYEFTERGPSGLGKRVTQHSHLSLLFARERNRWVMVFDQNTPIKQPE